MCNDLPESTAYVVEGVFKGGGSGMIDYYLTPEDYRIAEKNGISQQTAYRRFYQLNWSRKRTIHTPPRKMNKYGKWHDIAKQNGIKANAFMNRIYRGWDVERAATTPLNK